MDTECLMAMEALVCQAVGVAAAGRPSGPRGRYALQAVSVWTGAGQGPDPPSRLVDLVYLPHGDDTAIIQVVWRER